MPCEGFAFRFSFRRRGAVWFVCAAVASSPRCSLRSALAVAPWVCSPALLLLCARPSCSGSRRLAAPVPRAAHPCGSVARTRLSPPPLYLSRWCGFFRSAFPSRCSVARGYLSPRLAGFSGSAASSRLPSFGSLAVSRLWLRFGAPPNDGDG